jgi:hypothetical protein
VIVRFRWATNHRYANGSAAKLARRRAVGDIQIYTPLNATSSPNARAGAGSVVKKGSSVFEIRVYGCPVDQTNGIGGIF